MLEIENTKIYGWESAIRGMRNPMNSWKMSDSSVNVLMDEFEIGPNDKDLMIRLVKAGTDHSKFMRMITVTTDLIAPLYWWKEYDTYKIGTVRNSCSTMHKIQAKELGREDFSCEHLTEPSLKVLDATIEIFNDYREWYLKYDSLDDNVKSHLTGIHSKKDIWWQMIQLLPSSYNQRATIQINYAVLRSMYHARKNHKLDEWHTFCGWIESLPLAKELICDDFKDAEIAVVKADTVTTITYGKPQEWKDRKEAIKFFFEGVQECEGAERDRYMNVLTHLLEGETICRDE